MTSNLIKLNIFKFTHYPDISSIEKYIDLIMKLKDFGSNNPSFKASSIPQL